MPQNNFIPQDNEARLSAMFETDRNILVEAGAGTGKTTLLTNRLCYLILGKNIPIDQIIALTFTEKAAAEIKMRLLDTMRLIFDFFKGNELTEKEAQNIQKLSVLITNILNERKQQNKDKTEQQIKEDIIKDAEANFELAERAMISTIHSFCLKTLRRFSTEAQIPPDCQPVQQQALYPLLDKLWTDFLNEELAYNAPNAAVWEELLNQVSADDIKDFAFTLMLSPLAHYNPCLPDSSLAQELAARAKRAEDLFNTYRPQDGKLKNIDTAIQNAAEILQQAALYLDGKPYKDIPLAEVKSAGASGNWQKDSDDFKEASDIIALAQNSSADNLNYLKTAYKALQGFIAKAKKTLTQANLITFDDMIVKTRDLVKKYRHIRHTLKKEYKSILLDEFQDTDPQQGEIFIYLSEDDDSFAENWQDVKLKAGKLFIVGDPKQCIYCFRSADITAYENFCALMLKQGAKKCYLQSNFRSSANIVKFANIFGNCQIKETKGMQPPYTPIIPTKNYPPEQIQFLLTGQGLDSYGQREAQAAVIARWIKQNAGIKKLAGGRTLSYKDIAILYRYDTGLNNLIKAFRREGINYSVEEKKNFYQTQEIKDILNLLKLAQNPYDKKMLAGILRSPLFLVTDGDILEISQKGLLNIFVQTNNPYINNCFKQLKEICRLAKELPLKDFIDYIIFNTRFKEMEMLCSSGEQTSANINKFTDIARELSDSGITTLPQFTGYVENYLKAEKNEGESPLAEESLDTVKILTMHKSKGLQFPVVILYDMTRDAAKKGNKTPPLYLKDYGSGRAAPRIGSLADPFYFILKSKNKLHAAAEELRILYVAFTRAQEILLITGMPDPKGTTAMPLVQAGCYPAYDKDHPENLPEEILDGLCKVSYIDYQENQSPENRSKSSTENYLPDIGIWQKAWIERCKNYQNALPKQTLTPSGFNRKKNNSTAQLSAMASGKICHKIISIILKGGQINADNAAISEGYNPQEHKKEIKDAQKTVQDFIKSEAFKKLSALKLLAAEMPFTVKDENGILVNGVIDAVFEDSARNIFIADFKTDNINKEQVLQTAKNYIQQLRQYTKIAEKMFPNKKINGAIVFLRPQIICNLGEIKNV